MTQVYDILDKIRDRLRDNPSVFSVTFGDISEVDLNKTTIFPLSHLTITNVTFERSVVNFNIALLCLDVVDYNKEKYDDDIFYGNTNLQDIYNTQLQVVNDVVQSVRRGSLFDSKIQLIGDPVATPFKDKYENELAGWGVEINVSMINDISIC
tara:strand:- start:1348 stop:1806 length:459 start_codon:yes stop_codon:yes gene_type:complete